VGVDGRYGAVAVSGPQEVNDCSPARCGRWRLSLAWKRSSGRLSSGSAVDA